MEAHPPYPTQSRETTPWPDGKSEHLMVPSSNFSEGFEKLERSPEMPPEPPEEVEEGAEVDDVEEDSTADVSAEVEEVEEEVAATPEVVVGGPVMVVPEADCSGNPVWVAVPAEVTVSPWAFTITVSVMNLIAGSLLCW